MGEEHVFVDEKPPPPRSLLEVIEHLGPVLKYYLILLALYFVAKYANKTMHNDPITEAEAERPNLSQNLMPSSDESESDSDDHVDGEFTSNGSRLVEDGGVKQRKKSDKKKANELFEGLRQVEKEVNEEQKEDKDENNVSWNELHAAMLSKYKDKYPTQGPNIQTDDDYDDEFKDLLRKHNIDPEDIKRRAKQE